MRDINQAWAVLGNPEQPAHLRRRAPSRGAGHPAQQRPPSRLRPDRRRGHRLRRVVGRHADAWHRRAALAPGPAGRTAGRGRVGDRRSGSSPCSARFSRSALFCCCWRSCPSSPRRRSQLCGAISTTASRFMPVMATYLDRILDAHRRRVRDDSRSVDRLREDADGLPPTRGFAAAIRAHESPPGPTWLRSSPRSSGDPHRRATSFLTSIRLTWPASTKWAAPRACRCSPMSNSSAAHRLICRRRAARWRCPPCGRTSRSRPKTWSTPG